MTAGNDQPQTLKMSTDPENKINNNILSDKIHSDKDTLENKDIKHTVRKCIKFTNETYTESNNATSVNDADRQKIQKAKYIPGKEGDPVLEDFRILTGRFFFLKNLTLKLKIEKQLQFTVGITSLFLLKFFFCVSYLENKNIG